MNLRYKNILYSLGLLSAMFLVWYYRQGNDVPMMTISGETMGTTYHISYFDEEQRNFKSQVDSLLTAFNNSLNTYLPHSEISEFNQTGIFDFVSPYFLPVLESSEEIVSMTDGAFDPTVMPLVNMWGFGPQQNTSIDSAAVDSLRQFVGFERMITFDKRQVTKQSGGSTLDFSAIAKGYGVDVVSQYLYDQGMQSTFVEIGGEVVVRGKNLKTDKAWRIAIIDPQSKILNPEYIAYATLINQAVATSANNFNYRIVDGKKYSHTLDPKSGYPIVHEILSATVFTKQCMRADALATSFMVMGHEKAIKLIEENADIDAFLIYTNPEGGISTYISKGIKEQVELL